MDEKFCNFEQSLSASQANNDFNHLRFTLDEGFNFHYKILGMRKKSNTFAASSRNSDGKNV